MLVRSGSSTNEVSFSEAKARLTTFVDAAKDGQTTIITRHGKREAVIVPYEEWNRIAGPRSLWDLLLNAPIDGRDVERSKSTMRDADL